jgi:hypothetical protein
MALACFLINVRIVAALIIQRALIQRLVTMIPLPDVMMARAFTRMLVVSVEAEELWPVARIFLHATLTLKLTAMMVRVVLIIAFP